MPLVVIRRKKERLDSGSLPPPIIFLPSSPFPSNVRLVRLFERLSKDLVSPFPSFLSFCVCVCLRDKKGKRGRRERREEGKGGKKRRRAEKERRGAASESKK